ncbi:F420-dependent oxidoreductase family protein [Mycobacterium kansasii 732]|uniref:Pyrimidine monooxygenase RutA n=1 Tax=Mycobacterium pseudokansasii TaxID=2341080 RepID=A0A498QTL6_9MYCO|nr:LLM class F420-dependent oxidoreductase [Mycobacterium pseudokansasii]EUA08433.1 F420-dependent oxidoreductase family protein [Mycobacterium kansasii 732]KZS70115.1 LLM class F420-dependent oxidoreductase [Mycobacterium kansasii]MBY0391374.1 LLM class F420-dependent oxidoreductase [Mycobacterium pseudokansasii]VAZ91741.1 Pyrimidine monooxygenase RutA [Mycobacterium pseudokansasii]VAZ92679.1 Pyrimidine monooxygenase RutA [Mycobacterium pseudokansasii]
MRLGLHALGIGSGADRTVIDAVASAADNAGFATLWAGEHVVMVDRPASRYPYSDDGVIAVAAQADWLDPTIALAFAAAASSRIAVATGVLLLPEHNPVVVAKQAASLDRLSGGRLILGVGVGWLKEEFEALGVPFERRAARTAEYVAAMRTLWRDDVASFGGDFVAFDCVRVNPKPVRERRIPIVVGGNSDAAMRRVAAWADGWYGFNLDGIDAVRERVATLEQLCAESDRDRGELSLAVALRSPHIGDVETLAELGVDELVLVQAPPAEAGAVADWVSALADKWLSTTDAVGRLAR